MKLFLFYQMIFYTKKIKVILALIFTLLIGIIVLNSHIFNPISAQHFYQAPFLVEFLISTLIIVKFFALLILFLVVYSLEFSHTVESYLLNYYSKLKIISIKYIFMIVNSLFYVIIITVIFELMQLFNPYYNYSSIHLGLSLFLFCFYYLSLFLCVSKLHMHVSYLLLIFVGYFMSFFISGMPLLEDITTAKLVINYFFPELYLKGSQYVFMYQPLHVFLLGCFCTLVSILFALKYDL
ncbi:MAG: hypothetical protein K9L74_01145 [Candidatus Izimaplasma sp.]|nr:hypothetical protein [Candidatus Izimaplasma bacterium]